MLGAFGPAMRVTVPPTPPQIAGGCIVLIGSLGSSGAPGVSSLVPGYAECRLPTSHRLDGHAVCVHHRGYGAALPFTLADLRARLA